MNYFRITAHFNTVEAAKKARKYLTKWIHTEHCTDITGINKKVSIENDRSKLLGLPKSDKDSRMFNSRNIILSWLDRCKGLSYTVLVSR